MLARRSRSSATRRRCSAIPASVCGVGAGEQRRPGRARARPARARACCDLGVEREPHPEAELGVVLEQRVRPGRARGRRRSRSTASSAGCRRRSTSSPSRSRRASGRRELGEQLQVRRLAAALAGAGELEQRLQHLRALHRGRLDRASGRSPGSRGRSRTARARRRGARASARGRSTCARPPPSTWAGQVSTQIPQPVQSSGATWIVISIPGRSRARHSFDVKPSGAPSSAPGS